MPNRGTPYDPRRGPDDRSRHAFPYERDRGRDEDDDRAREREAWRPADESAWERDRDRDRTLWRGQRGYGYAAASDRGYGDRWSDADRDDPYTRAGVGGGSRWSDDDRDRRRVDLGGARRGGFRGHGPEGYARSDQRVLEDVSDRLTDDDEVDARKIQVRVQGGEVILTGHVPERMMKYRAEEIAASVTGVKDVDNQVRVARASDPHAATSPSVDERATTATTTSRKGGASA